MKEPSFPTCDLSQCLKDILDENNLTMYGAAMVAGAELVDVDIKTIYQRISRYIDKPPESWDAIVETLGALGYAVKIEKVKEV